MLKHTAIFEPFSDNQAICGAQVFETDLHNWKNTNCIKCCEKILSTRPEDISFSSPERRINAFIALKKLYSELQYKEDFKKIIND